MRARKTKSFQSDVSDRRLRDEIEADVFEIWVGVSRLMSRLRDPYASFKTRRRPGRRRRATSAFSSEVETGSRQESAPKRKANTRGQTV